jgi:hypothetical protein
MLLVTADQVEYCQVTYSADNEVHTVDGMSYGGKLFLNLHSFPKNEKQNAIEKAKFISVENKGHLLIILVEENNNYVIWQQNNEVKIKSQKPKEISISEIDLKKLVSKMRNIDGIRIEDRWYKLRVYRRCFVGNEAVAWLMESFKLSQENAIRVGQILIDKKFIHHVTDDHDFKDEYLFYRFYWDEKEFKMNLPHQV